MKKTNHNAGDGGRAAGKAPRQNGADARHQRDDSGGERPQRGFKRDFTKPPHRNKAGAWQPRDGSDSERPPRGFKRDFTKPPHRNKAGAWRPRDGSDSERPQRGFKRDFTKPPHRNKAGAWRPRDGSDSERPPRGFKRDFTKPRSFNKPPWNKTGAWQPRDGSDGERPPRDFTKPRSFTKPPHRNKTGAWQPRDGSDSERPQRGYKRDFTKPPRHKAGAWRPRDGGDGDRPPRDFTKPRNFAKPPHHNKTGAWRQREDGGGDERPQRGYKRDFTKPPRHKAGAWRQRDGAGDRPHRDFAKPPRRDSPRDFSKPPQRFAAPPRSEKVQKILARAGLGSRRLMEEWLKEGRIKINNRRAELGARAGAADRITIDGNPFHPRRAAARLLLYHKPKGKLVSREGENTVFDDLPEESAGRWLNIGRLDVATEGLLLFTTDGELAERMAHPSAGREREYRARVNGELPPQTMEAICRDGADIGDERRVHVPHLAPEESADGVNRWYRIVLTEGRNRIVRRLFEKHGLMVNRLLRVRFGEHRLPADLPPGGWRELPPPRPPAAARAGAMR